MLPPLAGQVVSTLPRPRRSSTSRSAATRARMTGLIGRGRGHGRHGPAVGRSETVHAGGNLLVRRLAGHASRPTRSRLPIDHGFEACCRLVGQVVGKDPQRLAGDVEVTGDGGDRRPSPASPSSPRARILGDARLIPQTRPVTFQRPCVTCARCRVTVVTRVTAFPGPSDGDQRAPVGLAALLDLNANRSEVGRDPGELPRQRRRVAWPAPSTRGRLAHDARKAVEKIRRGPEELADSSSVRIGG